MKKFSACIYLFSPVVFCQKKLQLDWTVFCPDVLACVWGVVLNIPLPQKLSLNVNFNVEILWEWKAIHISTYFRLPFGKCSLLLLSIWKGLQSFLQILMKSKCNPQLDEKKMHLPFKNLYNCGTSVFFFFFFYLFLNLYSPWRFKKILLSCFVCFILSMV